LRLRWLLCVVSWDNDRITALEIRSCGFMTCVVHDTFSWSCSFMAYVFMIMWFHDMCLIHDIWFMTSCMPCVYFMNCCCHDLSWFHDMSLVQACMCFSKHVACRFYDMWFFMSVQKGGMAINECLLWCLHSILSILCWGKSRWESMYRYMMLNDAREKLPAVFCSQAGYGLQIW
jgi:hypothetical protein